jgi:hypothetical protein
MGRSATIDQRDVAQAREGLRAEGLPHGIIAIRNRLGRGSPQLIARFVRELDGGPPADSPVKFMQRQLDEARRTIDERDRQIEHLHGDLVLSECRAAATFAENTRLVAASETLQRELDLQREMFEAWRGDQVRDRALLAARVEQLARTLAGPSRHPRTAVEPKSGEQLDLYGEPAIRD